jgi:hypothetical protein
MVLLHNTFALLFLHVMASPFFACLPPFIMDGEGVTRLYLLFPFCGWLCFSSGLLPIRNNKKLFIFVETLFASTTPLSLLVETAPFRTHAPYLPWIVRAPPICTSSSPLVSGCTYGVGLLPICNNNNFLFAAPYVLATTPF